MNRSDSIKEIATALSAMQGELQNPIKNSRNPHFGNRYADLTEILNTIRPVFARHGLSFIQNPYCDGDRTCVETVLMHSSGEMISGVISCKSSKDGSAQGIGSDITYLKRYSISSLAGLSAEDDLDGEVMPAKPVIKYVPKVASKFRFPPEEIDGVFLDLKMQAVDGGKDAFGKAWAVIHPDVKTILKADTARMGILDTLCKEFASKP